MSDYKKDMYAKISPDKIDDLMSIYEDYLFMARLHEQSILLTTDAELAMEQMNGMYSEGEDYPWHIETATEKEASEFADFTANNTKGDGKSTYISLKHIKDEEDNGKFPIFAPRPYESITLGMYLPSMVERFKICFPQNATLGNTKFNIDGRYKAVYTAENDKDKLLSEYLSDSDLQTKIVIMINMSERFRYNGYVWDDDFIKKSMLTYAEEKIAINENNLIEIIGSFSERMKSICQDIYKISDGRKCLAMALEDGLFGLPDNFLEYDDIRNLVRHQWESLDEFELFMPKKPKNPEGQRERRVNSYLKLFDKDDKTIHQRMKSYIGVLHQMQKIMAEINPNRLTRSRSESRNKFKKRVKEFAEQRGLDKPIEVELNYLPMCREFQILEKDLRKILPNVKIVDDVLNDESKYERLYNRMEAYKKRSDFLQSFHAVECSIIGHCIRHGTNCDKKGKNLNIHSALDYLLETGIIDKDEREKWRGYAKFRPELSHCYFSDCLKDEICDKQKEKEYNKDLLIMKKKLFELGPEVKKFCDDVFMYRNFDGKIVVLDYKNHKMLHSIKFAPRQTDVQKKNENSGTTYEYKPKNDYKNNNEGRAKVKIFDDKIKGVRLPSGVYIGMDTHNIDWGNRTRWYTNARYFNALQTLKSTIRTSKELKVTSFFEGSRNISFNNGDDLFIDNRYHLLLDETGKIKEFDFKNEKGDVVKTVFEHIETGIDRLSFADGTSVLISGKDIMVSHNGIVLSKNNIKEFEASYGTERQISPRFNKHYNER